MLTKACIDPHNVVEVISFPKVDYRRVGSNDHIGFFNQIQKKDEVEFCSPPNLSTFCQRTTSLQSQMY